MKTIRLVLVTMLVLVGCDTSNSDKSQGPASTVPYQPSASGLKGISRGWTELPLPPEVRFGTATGWTGDLLLVWGGFVFTGSSDKPAKADGFAFNVQTGTWDPLLPSPLSARRSPASVWTGSELLIWGGSNQGAFFDDGAAYNPATEEWRPLPTPDISARAPEFVWTGEEMIVWGAGRVQPRRRDGAAYDPGTNRWRAIAESPVDLTDASTVWTGEEMVVFGAALHGGNFPESGGAIGAAYSPSKNSWRKIPRTSLSPQASTAAWNGRYVVAWDYLHGSAAYDPNENDWRGISDVPLEEAECSPQSVSIGKDVFGNYCGQMAIFDGKDFSWRQISTPHRVAGGFNLVFANEAVLLFGQDSETGDKRALAYRPIDTD